MHTAFNNLRSWLASQIIGQPILVDRLLIALLADGHLLVEGAPGLAKTKAVKALSDGIEGSFQRIQFTPDLLPSDITGTEIYRPENATFAFQQGPIFNNLVLADEINRAPAKVQSALLEAMAERQVSVGRETFDLPSLFLVMATQNPIEQEGTYPLPEAQLDRFMFNIWLDYPSYEEELQVIKNTTSDRKVALENVISGEEILYFQQLVRRVPVPDNVMEYAVSLVHKTRPNEQGTDYAKQYISWGAGPRASQNLILGAKCNALIKGKYSPDIEDVQAVALDILRHRVVRNYKAEAEGLSIEDIIGKLL